MGAVALALVLAACTGDDEEAGLTVFAAASLRTVMADLEDAWLAEHPDAPLTVASGASNVLAAQISEGAPAEVFMSADADRPWMLTEAGLTAAEPVHFARNVVTLVTPIESEQVVTAADLATPGVRIVATNRGAPITHYAGETIGRIAARATDPDAFSGAVEANTVSREDNVRAALAKVELGEGDAAFVYRTDALGSDDVREVTLPADTAAMAHYAAVQISERPLAADFVAWLREPAASTIINAAGFETDA